MVSKRKLEKRIKTLEDIVGEQLYDDTIKGTFGMQWPSIKGRISAIEDYLKIGMVIKEATSDSVVAKKKVIKKKGKK